MDRLIKYVFVANLCLMATVFSWRDQTVDATVPTRNYIFGIATAVLFLLIVMDRRNFDFSIIKMMIFPAFAFYFLVVTYSIILCDMPGIVNSTNTGEAIYGSVRTFVLMVFLFEAALILNKDTEFFLKAVVVVTIMLGIYGVYQFFTIENTAARTGTMANMNTNSSSFFIFLVLSVYLILQKKWIIPATIAAVLCVFVILTLRTRAVWLALFVAAIVFAATKRKYVMVVIVVLPLALGLIWSFRGSAIFSTASMVHRTQMWRQIIRQARDRPLGIGAENWKIHAPLYHRYMAPEMREKVYRNETFGRPHNGFLKTLSETGWAGLSGLLLLFAISLYYSRSNRVILAGISGIMLITFFSYLLERPCHSMMLMVLFALAIKCHHKPSSINLKSKWIYALTAIVAAGLCFSIYNFAVRHETSCRIMRIYKAKLTGQWKTIISETDRISALSTVDNTGTPLLFYRGLAAFWLGQADEAVKVFIAAQKENPNHLHSIMNLGTCYTYAKELDKAQECYEKVVQMYPDFEGAKKGLHTLDVFSGRLIGMK